MTPLLNRFLEQLLLPPGVILTGMTLAWLLLVLPASAPLATRIRRGRTMLGGVLILSWLATLPVVAHGVADRLHPPARETALTTEKIHKTDAQAIVLFGYGRASQAPEYDGEDTLSPGGLARVRYAARLHRLTGLPLLVAGGRPYGETRSEAAIMREVLETEFQVPVAWMEEKSRDTWENAAFSATMLQQAGITRVLLVVHNRDVPRALLAFRKSAGERLQVTPAPILFRTAPPVRRSWDPLELIRWIPNADALSLLAVELHEWLGQLWYQWRG
ncbi:MAG: YdcF family protein [Magnetococcales bacterium]|nr:YdcF family protein [Magnetococcales bacterium]